MALVTLHYSPAQAGGATDKFTWGKARDKGMPAGTGAVLSLRSHQMCHEAWVLASHSLLRSRRSSSSPLRLQAPALRLVLPPVHAAALHTAIAH